MNDQIAITIRIYPYISFQENIGKDQTLFKKNKTQQNLTAKEVI